MDNSLPFLAAPRDVLRDGLHTLKDQVEGTNAHPVEQIQNKSHHDPTRLELMQNVYGTALPARMEIERQILNRVERLPGLPSSKLGLESLNGTLDDFSFDSYLGLPSDSEVLPTALHDSMEQRLGLDTKPCAKGLF